LPAPAPAPEPDPEPQSAPESAAAPAPVLTPEPELQPHAAPNPTPAAHVEAEVEAPAPDAPKEDALKAQSVNKRELEQTPLILRKSSKILLAGALLPFFTALDPEFSAWGPLYLSKALVLLAGWVFHQGYMATHGGKGEGLIGKLAQQHAMVPTCLAGIVAIAAFVPAYLAGSLGGIGGESATLLLACATFSHIFGYEHGGKFNPIFPLMFLGPGIAGVLNVFGAMALFGEQAGRAAMGLAGSLVVGAGGMMAIYAMYAAMRQAKAEGDIKREAQRAGRKAQREAQRAAGGDSPRRKVGRKGPGNKKA